MPNKNNKNEIRAAVTHTTYQGPIPPAVEMERYKAISSDFPQKIIQMAIDEQQHRFELDNAEQKRQHKELEANIALVKRGIFASVFCILLIMGASVMCAYFGQAIPAGIIGGGGVCVIVSVFVCGSKIKSSGKK